MLEKSNKNFLQKEITRLFNQYVLRDPNPSALKFFTDKISNEEIKLEQLPIILKNSEEHKNIQLWKHGCVYTKYGYKMYVNPKDLVISRSLGMNFVWEKSETEFILDTVKKKMNTIDIGANIGYYTILLSKLVGDSGKVFSFEPSRENYSFLKKNIQANQGNNVRSFQKAVSDSNKIGTLFLNDKNLGDHRIFDFIVSENDKNRKSVEIDCVTLDSIIPEDIPFHFIKMDIQGAEILALKGMKKIIERSDFLKMVLEFWPFALEKSGYQPQEFISIIREFGFRIYVLENDEKKPMKDDFDLIHNYQPNDYTNLICEK